MEIVFKRTVRPVYIKPPCVLILCFVYTCSQNTLEQEIFVYNLHINYTTYMEVKSWKTANIYLNHIMVLKIKKSICEKLISCQMADQFCSIFSTVQPRVYSQNIFDSELELLCWNIWCIIHNPDRIVQHFITIGWMYKIKVMLHKLFLFI